MTWQIRTVHSQVRGISKRNDATDEVQTAADSLVIGLTTIEETLYQTKNQSRQDPLNFPNPRLNNKLAAVASNASIGAFQPTDQAVAVRDDITEKLMHNLRS